MFSFWLIQTIVTRGKFMAGRHPLDIECVLMIGRVCEINSPKLHGNRTPESTLDTQI